jgi:flagellar hook protein FlgE
MSIFGSMRTSVSGMNAQANRLGTISDNIANSATTGYKSASTSFSDMVMPSTGGGSYQSGGVQTTTQYEISQQGGLSYTTSTTDLAIKGDGFFVVQDASGATFLTRAGDFSPDSSGNLVNSAGFTLMGYSTANGDPSVVVNGLGGMTAINVNADGLKAVATSTATLAGNLNSTADIPDSADNLPASNTAPMTADTSKTSLVTYDSQGNSVKYDVYYTKTSDSTWDVSVYNAADATTGGTSSFPYSSAAVGSTTLTFDANGNLTSGDPGNTLTITNSNAPVGTTQTISVDLSSMTQLASKFAPTGEADGQAANSVKGVTIGTDGTVTATYEDGTSNSIARIPLATVASPDKLTVLSGNVYQANADSGVTITGFPQSGNMGYIQSGALEESNVDLATELTDMIETQKSYTANSKVFQTGSDLMDVIDNLVR